MIEEHYLREENYQLKNEITDLKNAFDLNRDILKLLSNYNHKSDPHFSLLMQIITRLTSVNNQAMINNIELIQHKNILKQENLKLNLALNRLEEKLEHQLSLHHGSTSPSQSKLMMQDQFTSLSQQLLAANQQRIIKEQQLQYWKDKFIQIQSNGISSLSETASTHQSTQELSNFHRKYTSNPTVRNQLIIKDLKKTNRRLQNYIEQLQNRLIIFIKAHQMEEEMQGEEVRESKIPFFEIEREEIRLLKYALNDIRIDRKEDECILTITQRFKGKDVHPDQYSRQNRCHSWPKHQLQAQMSKKDKNGIRGNKIEEKEEEQQQYHR